VFWCFQQLLSETFLILRIQRDAIHLHRSSRKAPVIPVRVQIDVNFLDRISKNSQISNFMKICPIWAELFNANERTDRRTGGPDEANSRFLQILRTCLKIESIIRVLMLCRQIIVVYSENRMATCQFTVWIICRNLKS
jgi:hypothetical protein